MTVLFMTGAILSIAWGLAIFRLNKKLMTNQVFLLLSLALSIWLVGFALANSANTYDLALFWRRFGSIGMISLYSFVLHFFLLLTRQDQDHKVKRSVYLLYVPAILLIYVFTFSPTLASKQYELIQTEYGLTNIADNTLWNYFYYVYFASYMLAGIAILIKWRKKIKEPRQRKQASIVIGMVLFSGILSTLTDIVTTTFMSQPLPQIAPLFILIPVWAMHSSATAYGMLNINKKTHVEIVVTEQDKQIIFKNVSRAFYLGAILAFFAQYLPYMDVEDSFQRAILNSLMIASIGLAIRAAQSFQNNRVRENLTIFILVSSIPLIILQYVQYGSITIWIFPVVIIISSIIFSRLFLLISASIVAIITQILIWTMNPQVTVVVDQYDYILRIGLFILIFLIAFYINKMYVGKIKENNERINAQEIISDILFDFVSVNQKNLDEKVNNLLEKMGIFLAADRVYLLTFNKENETLKYSNEWCNKGIRPEMDRIGAISFENSPWLVDELYKQRLVMIEDVNRMLKHTTAAQKSLQERNIKSLMLVPVMGEAGILAVIGIDSLLNYRNWSDNEMEMFVIMSNILYGGLMQVEADKEIEFMAYYDQLTRLPNRSLFNDRVEQAIHLSERTGKYIAIIFVDLDNFKAVNDTFGHKTGDELLKEVANSLSGITRRSDTVSRFGGDEFLLMINDIQDEETVIKILEKIMVVFDGLFKVTGQELLITASAGAAIYPHDGKDTDTLVKHADIAMYQAKENGKNQYALFSEKAK